MWDSSDGSGFARRPQPAAVLILVEWSGGRKTELNPETVRRLCKPGKGVGDRELRGDFVDCREESQMWERWTRGGEQSGGVTRVRKIILLKRCSPCVEFWTSLGFKKGKCLQSPERPLGWLAVWGAACRVFSLHGKQEEDWKRQKWSLKSQHVCLGGKSGGDPSEPCWGWMVVILPGIICGLRNKNERNEVTKFSWGWGLEPSSTNDFKVCRSAQVTGFGKRWKDSSTLRLEGQRPTSWNRAQGLGSAQVLKAPGKGRSQGYPLLSMSSDSCMSFLNSLPRSCVPCCIVNKGLDPLIRFIYKLWPDMVAHAFNPSTWEAEADRS